MAAIFGLPPLVLTIVQLHSFPELAMVLAPRVPVEFRLSSDLIPVEFQLNSGTANTNNKNPTG